MIRSTFAIPAMIAVLSVIGLVVALTGDGWRDAVSWVGLGLPVAAVGWAIVRRRRISSGRTRAPIFTKGKQAS